MTTPSNNPPTPRTNAMLASIQGGKLLGTDDSVTHEEDYYDKSLTLLRQLETELIAANAELVKLRKDKEMLDWLESTGDLFAQSPDLFDWQKQDGISLRTAITAAMKKG